MTLTARQAELLRFIQAYADQHGVAPTLREMAEGFGYSGVGAATRLAHILQRKGYIRRIGHGHRAIEVLRPPEPAKTALQALQDALAPFPMRERVEALAAELERLERQDAA